mgnify:CR=1 FL=1
MIDKAIKLDNMNSVYYLNKGLKYYELFRRDTL